MCVYLLEPRCKLRGIKSPSMGIKSLLPADMSHDDECSYTVAVVLSFVLKFSWARKKKRISDALSILLLHVLGL